MDMKFLDRRRESDYLLPNLSGGRSIVYNDESYFLPTLDEINHLLPENQIKLQMYNIVSDTCLSMAMDILLSQDESIIDDYFV